MMRRYYPVILMLLLTLFIGCLNMQASETIYLPDSVSDVSVEDKQAKKSARKNARIELRHSHYRFSLRASYVYAFLDTKVSFELPQGNLNSTLSLEQNLGLPGKSSFFTGSFLYRITPRSGIYAHYYGINRSENHQTEQDYIFLRDTIPSGTNIKAHFNTQVISAGYLLSVLGDPNAFLGFYFNLYFMFLETGVESDLGSINPDVKLAAPLPNFGILASFRLNKWLYLNGGIGFFALHTSTFSGSLYNFDLSLMAKPFHFMGVSLSYQEFDVNVEFPSDNINTIIDYNFRGPSIGLSFIF